MTALTEEQQNAALGVIATWLGKEGLGVATCRNGLTLDNALQHRDSDGLVTDCVALDFGPAPTGHDAAMHALGPMLAPEWDWPSEGPTPTILLEGGPYDWAIEASCDPPVIATLAELGIWAEPYAGYALCLYSTGGDRCNEKP